MSFEYMAAAWEVDVDDGLERLILMALANHADDDGICFPSINKIASKCCVSRSTVKRRIDGLEQKGYVSHENRESPRGDMTSSSYTLNIETYQQLKAKASRTGRVCENLPPVLSEPTIYNQSDNQKKRNIKESEQDAAELYDAYPRKVGRGQAIRAIQKALKTVDKDTLLEAVREYSEAVSTWPKSDRQFIPHAATWFNGTKWEDDRDEWYRGNVKPSTYAGMTDEERRRAIADEACR